MSFSRSNTTKAYPLWGLRFLFPFSSAWVSRMMRIWQVSVNRTGRKLTVDTHTLNRAKATKLALQILLVGLVVETRNDACLECVPSDVGVLIRVVCWPVSKCVKRLQEAMRVQSLGASATSLSAASFFSRILRSRFSNQLSVGWYSYSRSYWAREGRKAATPSIGAVLRFSGAWSQGGTHLRGGLGAKSARRLGGSLSVMVTRDWAVVGPGWRSRVDAVVEVVSRFDAKDTGYQVK